MGTKIIYKRSALGARVRSPLGAFIGRSASYIEIFTWPIIIFAGETYTLTGELFGATQGAGTVQVANTPAFDDVVVTQTVSAWDDDSITFDYDGTGLPDDGLLWIRVTNNSAQSDTVVTQAGSISSIVALGSASWGETGYFCGLAGWYCGASFGFDSDLVTAGYRDSNELVDFWSDTPGFYLIGATSAKTVEYGYRTGVYSGTLGESVSWCGGAEGDATFHLEASLYILYDDGLAPLDPCMGTHGWTSGETVYLVPKYPASVQIVTPADNSTYLYGQDVDFTGAAYAQEGDISASIEWYRLVGSTWTLFDTGSAATLAAATESFNVLALIENAHGQRRRTAMYTINIELLTLEDMFPYVGNESGGQRVTIYGTGFSATTEVFFDGVLATAITLISSTIMQVIAPAGTGTIEISAEDTPQSFTLADPLFAYGTDDNLSITTITPDTDVAAGGAAITIAGTGFTADCSVYIGGELADSISFVSSTEITCNAPASPGGAIVTDLMVLDEVTGAGDIVIGGFTYT